MSGDDGITQLSPAVNYGVAGAIEGHATDLRSLDKPPPGPGDWASTQGTDDWNEAVDDTVTNGSHRLHRHTRHIRDVTGKLVEVDEQNAAAIDGVRAQMDGSAPSGGGGHQGLGDAIKLGDLTTPFGTLGAGLFQSAAGIAQALATEVGQLTNVGGQLGAAVAKTPGISAGANAGPTGSGGGSNTGSGADTGGGAAGTAPASAHGGVGAGAPVGGSAGAPGDHARNGNGQDEVVPAANPMPFGGGMSGLPAAGGGASSGKVRTVRLVTDADRDQEQPVTEPVVDVPFNVGPVTSKKEGA